MWVPHCTSVMDSLRAGLGAGVVCAAIALVVSSCSAAAPVVQHTAEPGVVAVPEPHYSIVCVIHGDGEYAFHDSSGNEHMADEEALTAMTRVAVMNPRAEVFIFHEQERRHVLFFPRKDGELAYYRNGLLVARESYWRDEGPSYFSAEVELYHKHKYGGEFDDRKVNGTTNMFLYFGHEIPESGGKGYDASYPDRPFAVADLAAALRGFAGPISKFDLLVLSTCFGGTPYTIAELGVFARTIVASPENLHLSYFDLRPLERLDLTLRSGEVAPFAKRLARHAFDCLTREIQTAVSVVVYDVDSVQGYVRSVRAEDERMQIALRPDDGVSASGTEHVDCADVPVYNVASMTEGVTVLYQPPRFGRWRNKLRHSGWECRRKTAAQASAVEVDGQPAGAVGGIAR